jgi:glycosyltransferase involved in cell wall biosynthesis
MLLADRGWRVTILSSPSAETAGLTVAKHFGVKHVTTPLRGQNAVRPFDYLYYTLASAGHALRLRPQLIYASDPIGALPALAAAKVSGAQIIYHEHDTPAPSSLRRWLARMRSVAAWSARLVVFPNEVRSAIARDELGLPADRIQIVWNVPRRAELPILRPKAESPLIVYYHGSITPDRLPETVVEAVKQLRGRVRLRFAGYEAPGAPGYVARLLSLDRVRNGDPLIQYTGQIPTRTELLTEATQAHVGLALMPRSSKDVNMLHMTGASNKAFDYMAAGLALLVSDLADWRETFVARGLARACDPDDTNSLVAALNWFLDHPQERRAMAARGRNKIETDWNYDTAFAPVIAAMENG